MPPTRSLDLDGSPDDFDLVTSDVFDTLLLRDHHSARTRLVAGERRFARHLAEQGHPVDPEVLIRLRLLAERLAYRALNVGGGRGEVRFSDITARQLAVLGLPPALVAARLAIEIDTEKTALTANRPLAETLRRWRRAGVRVAAVSDTALPGAALAQLIDHFHGPGLLDRVYSSADMAASKRQGELFTAVLAAEGVTPARTLHLGDDAHADVQRPRRLGLTARHLPRGRWRKALTLADAARTEAWRHWSWRTPGRGAPPTDRQAFGQLLLGPVVAEFCLRIWLYAREAEAMGDAVLLFCARGGIGIREAFERLLTRLDLPLAMPRGNVLVSRLIAARAAIVARAPSVLDELGREFAGDSFAAVAAALGGRSYDLPADWQQPFDAAAWFARLDSAAGAAVLADITAQNGLFVRHLHDIAGPARRVILCDTGLYGSTQRLLADGLPEFSFETIQFARCNYKGLSEDHFPRVVGLVVEQDGYSPFRAESAVLRYWHLIESLFEPAVASVQLFHVTPTGTVAANCGEVGYGRFDPAAGNDLLTGALRYIDGLAGGADLVADAARAWPRLHRAIVWPRRTEVELLGLGPRSRDFGRASSVDVLGDQRPAGLIARLRAVKGHLWREGAIARDFPGLAPVLLWLVEAAHGLRALRRAAQRRS